MTHKSPKTLDMFRGAGLCDYCGCRVPFREAHHVFSRGTGRIDVRICLAALCPTWFGQECHRRFHDGHICRKLMIERVARREKTKPEWIEAVVNLIRRLDKDGRRTLKGRSVSEEFADLESGARELAVKTLQEMGIEIAEAA